MKRSKGLAGQMAKQMHTTKGAAKGMLVRAKKMNDEEGFKVGGVGIGKTPHIDMNLLVDPYTGKKVYPVKGDKVKMFQGGGPAHHGPSSGVRRLSDSTHQARPRYFVRGGGVAVRGNTYRGVS